MLNSADSAVVEDCVVEQGSRFADLAHSDALGAKSPLPLGEGVVLVFGMSGRQKAVKRAFDVAFSLIAMIVLTPLLCAIGLAVAMSSPGPMLYRGTRIGEGGQLFEVLKFRTMLADADERLARDPDLLVLHRNNGFKLPQEIDTRITPIGRFLRRTSLDELPQLWNILVGEMSVVGARPVVPDELADYGPLVPVYVAARPGLTGHWQVYGRGKVGFPERAYLDLQNLLDWKLRSDIGLILRTVPAVLSARGAY